MTDITALKVLAQDTAAWALVHPNFPLITANQRAFDQGREEPEAFRACVIGLVFINLRLIMKSMDRLPTSIRPHYNADWNYTTRSLERAN